MSLLVYIGHDGREQSAFDVAAKTARAYGCEVIPLYEDRLRVSGMLTRPLDRRGGMFDLNSNAPQSTDFAIARFFVPLLAHAGWALFVDSDVVFVSDPHELLGIADETKACMVVKHPAYTLPSTKMSGHVQEPYPRKLWSSVCLWNASHPANKRLNLTTLNQWPGRDLHAFSWLADSEIGEIPKGWNHLVGIMPHTDDPKILHFTSGTPDKPEYQNCEYADLWRSHANA